MTRMTAGAELSAADRASLEACPPLVELGEANLGAVIDACKVRGVGAGATIFEHGERGDAFYVLLDGSVEVLRIEGAGAEIRLVELGPGAYFGEQALLGRSPGKRNATVRTTKPSRWAEFPAELFRARIATSGRNNEAFERNAAHFAFDQMRKSLEAFASSRIDETAEGVSRVVFAPGQTVMAQGEPSDAAFLVLEGVGLVVHERGESSREVSHVGTGQVIGELGVLQGKPRSATVVAESRIEALRIEAGAFRDWQAAHPGSTQFFDSLAEVYTLNEGRRLSVFFGDVDGHQAITTVSGERTDGVVSTRILDRGVVVFANARADTISGDREAVVFAEGRRQRELRVIVNSRKGGRIESCVLHGVAAEGIDSDLGELYHRVSQLDELSALELRRFERTGYLGGGPDARSKGIEGKLCPCLGIGPVEMRAAIDELGTDFTTLRTAIGVGTLCGGCETAVRAFIQRPTPAADGGRVGARCPVDHSQALEKSGYPLNRIRSLLKSWDTTGSGLG